MKKLIRPNITEGKWYLEQRTDDYTSIVRSDNGRPWPLMPRIVSFSKNTDPKVRANAKITANTVAVHDYLAKQWETLNDVVNSEKPDEFFHFGDGWQNDMAELEALLVAGGYKFEEVK